MSNQQKAEFQSSVEGADPYALNPASLTLKNKLCLTDAGDLVQAELVFTSMRRTQGVPIGDYGWNHLKRVHQHLFQDVYDWAGEAREVDMTATDGKPHTPPAKIDAAMEVIFSDLKKDGYLFGLEGDALSRKFAHYYNRMSEVHPFRRGSGRTIRVFLELAARNNGLEFSWSKIDRTQWREALVAARAGELKGLNGCFGRVTREYVMASGPKYGQANRPGASSKSAAEKAIKLVSIAVKEGKGLGSSGQFDADHFADIPSRGPSMD